MKLLSIFTLLVLFSAPATAYVGPGLGMGVIGTIFGVLAAIVLALFGLFWYPMKRAYNRRQARAEGSRDNPTITEHDTATRQDTDAAAQLNTASKTTSGKHATSFSDADSEVSAKTMDNRTDEQVQ